MSETYFMNECTNCYMEEYNALCVRVLTEDPIQSRQIYFRMLQVLGNFSGLVLLVVGLYLLSGKKFKLHPYPLMGLACICQGLEMTMFDDVNDMCEFHIPLIFVWTRSIFQWSSVEDFKQWITLNNYIDVTLKWQQAYNLEDVMRLTHSITFTYASTLNNLINSLLFMDLFLTIRNPFYQRSKRIPLYCIFIFIVEAILTGLIIMTINDVDIVYGRIPKQMA